MLPNFRSAFRVEEYGEETKNGSPIGAGSNKGTKDTNSTLVVGLKILVQISPDKSNVVVKSTASSRLPDYKATEFYCYLKSCHLCNKKLSLDKDVYMYRGDLGFCSIECRNRQIYLDDTKELEKSTKQMIASYRHCSSSDDRRETQNLIKELRRQRQKHMPQKIQWAIVS